MVKFIGFLVVFFSAALWAGSEMKDPTKPYQSKGMTIVSASQKEVIFNVTSILKRKKAAWAIINGVKASVGEHVEGAKIVRIDHDKVLINTGDSQRWLPLSNKKGLKQSR